jgi:hypothetical protein
LNAEYDIEDKGESKAGSDEWVVDFRECCKGCRKGERPLADEASRTTFIEHVN